MLNEKKDVLVGRAGRQMIELLPKGAMKEDGDVVHLEKPWRVSG